ncbi:MAG: RNA polymerase sigma factor [Planctomycetota bacterium JB042]
MDSSLTRPTIDGSATDLEPLVERARGGDRTAVDRLHDRFSSLVHGILLAAAPPSDVEDLMQDVFLAAWRGLPSLRGSDHLGAWLATIARNRARRRHARARPAEAMLPDEVEEPARGGPTSEGEEILAVVRSLPPAYAETLSLRLVEGMTGPEIAERTGLTHGSVRVNLSRGMKMLREALEKRGYA